MLRISETATVRQLDAPVDPLVRWRKVFLRDVRIEVPDIVAEAANHPLRAIRLNHD